MPGKDWRDEFLEIGGITKAHGLRGELRAFFLAGVPVMLAGIRELRVQVPDTGVEDTRLERIRPRGNGYVLTLACCRGRDRAEALAGSSLWVARRLLPPYPDRDFFWRGAVGLDVRTASGRALGRVADVFFAGAGDILVIRGRGNEYLVPARPEFVARVEDGCLTIIPPEGLLELYERSAPRDA